MKTKQKKKPKYLGVMYLKQSSNYINNKDDFLVMTIA